MANPFFMNTRTYLPATQARGDIVDNDFDAVEAGFDLVEVETKRSIKLAIAAGSEEITETPAGRINKILGFDSAGALVLLTPAGIGAALPNIMAGDAGRFVVVNVAENGFEYAQENNAARYFYGQL